MLYVVALSEDKCVTHDGDMDMGVFNFGVEKFLSMVGVDAMEVYWRPDPKGNRYKRVNFQRTEKVAGKDALESMSGGDTSLDVYRRNRVV